MRCAARLESWCQPARWLEAQRTEPEGAAPATQRTREDRQGEEAVRTSRREALNNTEQSSSKTSPL